MAAAAALSMLLLAAAAALAGCSSTGVGLRLAGHGALAQVAGVGPRLDGDVAYLDELTRERVLIAVRHTA